MAMTEASSGRYTRREIQGPRPAPLRVSKDSQKIRKPPVPAPHTHAPPRPPVIIYTDSPKIIHANPKEFMSLVQRLTGSEYSTSAAPSSVAISSFSSPAARLASVEKARTSQGRMPGVLEGGLELVESSGLLIQRTGHSPAGILSPNPNSLPLHFFPDHSNRINYLDNTYSFSTISNPTPSAPFSPPINMPSPKTFDLFSTLFDL